MSAPHPVKEEVGRSMIGLVLVTHGRLAAEFVAALEHVVGKQERIAAVCIGAEDYMEARRREIIDRISEVDNGNGVVLLTDMFGGTPSNLAISVLDRGSSGRSNSVRRSNHGPNAGSAST